MSVWQGIKRFVLRGLVFLSLLFLVTGSGAPLRGTTQQVRQFTRPLEFGFVNWTLDALWVKFQQLALDNTDYMNSAGRTETVRQFMALLDQIQSTETKITDIYGDPSIKDPQTAAAGDQATLNQLKAKRDALQPTVETILEQQVSEVLDRQGLGPLGTPFPPVAFHFSKLPWALIISPRNVIREEASIELLPDVTVAQQVKLENEVEKALNVSALVVPVGGLGTYPTMVQETGSMSWTAEVVSHEWTHNYLTLRPLGLNYDASAALRTMNETTASLIGKTMSKLVLKRYYPDLVPPAPAPAPTPPPSPSQPPAFDFNQQMRITRVHVDQLLAAGKIDEAESYMDARRLVFWDHGYHIRKLNQAYFAFYGSYADVPGGAAGNDPVGAAVRELWNRAASPAAFLRQMSWLSNYEQLKALLAKTANP